MCVYTCIIYICTQYNNCWMLQLSLHISSVECVWKETETERERGNDLGSCRLWDVFTSTRPRPFPAAPDRFASSVCRIGTRGQQKSLKASSRFSSLFLRLFYLSVSFSLSKYPLYSIYTLTNIYIYIERYWCTTVRVYRASSTYTYGYKSCIYKSNKGMKTGGRSRSRIQETDKRAK